MYQTCTKCAYFKNKAGFRFLTRQYKNLWQIQRNIHSVLTGIQIFCLPPRPFNIIYHVTGQMAHITASSVARVASRKDHLLRKDSFI